MIPRFYLDEWRQQAPWVTLAQVEQDLIISRALVHLYERDSIQETLAFRGGTALNKIFIQPAARYSEDIDLVQIQPEPIGYTMAEIRAALDHWLGEPKYKVTARSVKMVYRYLSEDAQRPMKLKVEINTTEHLHLLDFYQHHYSVNSGWFSGESSLKTYQLNELMGTKLRALYQRRKGRDLFDLWLVLSGNLIDPEQVVTIFQAYCKHNQEPISRAEYEKNLNEKMQHQDFIHDVTELVASDINWSLMDAEQLVRQELIERLSGEGWKGSNVC
jgi:predicted nucleotidyltransferase component of viral defense system